MARGLNKVMLIGNLGNDPEMRTTASGTAVANLSVATAYSYKDNQTGEWRDATEWHRVVFFGRTAEVARDYLRKGSQIYVEGRLQTSKWQDQNGVDKYRTDIIGENMQMLGGRGDAMGGGNYPTPPAQQNTYTPPPQQNTAAQQPSYTPPPPNPAPTAPPIPTPPPASSNTAPPAAPASGDSFDDDIPF